MALRDLLWLAPTLRPRGSLPFLPTPGPAVNDDEFCRLCLRSSVGACSHGKGPSVLEANRHGQQLFFVDLFRQKRPPRRGPAADLPDRNTYQVAHEQLTLVHVRRETAVLRTPPDLPDREFALLLERGATDHARARGWSKTTVNTARHGVRILACLQDPGALLKASEVAQLDPAAFSQRPILAVLAAAGLLYDDREPTIIG